MKLPKVGLFWKLRCIVQSLPNPSAFFSLGPLRSSQCPGTLAHCSLHGWAGCILTSSAAWLGIVLSASLIRIAMGTGEFYLGFSRNVFRRVSLWSQSPSPKCWHLFSIEFIQSFYSYAVLSTPSWKCVLRPPPWGRNAAFIREYNWRYCDCPGNFPPYGFPFAFFLKLRGSVGSHCPVAFLTVEWFLSRRQLWNWSRFQIT